ncbi:MAG TPA: DUF4160 domain-containing protein [Spirochaetia bacterium]|nr:DUF4160 domain-containing protein [Spirochaetia bacterium]
MGSSIVSRFDGVIIKMYPLNHLPPHFHVEYGEYEAVIDIANLTLRAGSLPPKVLSRVLEWAKLHQQKLLYNWKLVKQGQYPLPI